MTDDRGDLVPNRKGREAGSKNVTNEQRQAADEGKPDPANDCTYWESEGEARADARNAEFEARRRAGS